MDEDLGPAVGSIAPDPQAKRNEFSGTLWKEMEKHQEKERRWKSKYYALVGCSVIGNIMGTVGVLSSMLDDHRVILGLLVALPTIAFAIDKALCVAEFARWHQRAGDAYADLYDGFYFEDMPLSEGLRLKRAVDKELRRDQPGPSPLGEAPVKAGAPAPDGTAGK